MWGGHVGSRHESRRQEAVPLISLVVYGRNDQHGYNSHRRVALSLNAMAEVLTGTDDEILFVDYHTPHGMPTLPEAIEDTLTDRAIALMRVLKVTPEMHMAAVGDRSRLPISEPHARNTAIRHAHPGNWILSTNTDMVFVPRGEKSLTDLVAELDGEAYCLPRFEIPEWLWESVPRNDPHRMIELLHDWGERIGLDEVTLGHDWILYDAPGDFQLVRRELMEEVHGFDEQMIHGWHVDSNLWKRIYNRTGHIGTLYPDIAGYHTNHNRTLTRLMEAQSTGNDLGHFVYEVEHSSLPAQADTWGFQGVDVTEVPLRRANPMPLLEASAVRSAGQAGPLITSDTREQISVLNYDARHILPFALDPVIGEFPRPSMGYVGINDSTAQMLAAAASELDCPGGLALGDAAARDADVVILDLGVDASTGRRALTRDEAHTARAPAHATSDPHHGGDGQQALLPALKRAIDILRARDPQPRILLINAISGIWEAWVRPQFTLSYGTFHTRIQPAELKTDLPDEPIDAWMERRLVFITRDPEELAVAISDGDGEVVDLAEGADYFGLDEAWESVDEAGAYVGSGTAYLRFRSATSMTGPVRVTVQMAIWTTSTRATTPVSLCISLDGRILFDGVPPTVAQIVNLHANTDLDGRHDHDLAVTVTMDDGSVYSPRMSGGTQPWVRLGAVSLHPAKASTLVPGEDHRMSPGSAAEMCLDGIWTKTNPYGAWNLGPSGAMRVAVPAACNAVALELLGHPGRGDAQGVRVTAKGLAEITVDIEDLSATEPRDYSIPLPASAPGGAVTLEFEAIGIPAPSGEVVEVRGLSAVSAG